MSGERPAAILKSRSQPIRLAGFLENWRPSGNCSFVRSTGNATAWKRWPWAFRCPITCCRRPEPRWMKGQLQALLAWCGKRQVVHQGSSRPRHDLLTTIVPPGMTADVVAGPLGDAENPPASSCLWHSPARPSRIRMCAWSRPSSSLSRWPWKTTSGSARWLPCGPRPRPTRNRC